jgi:lipid II isoglutaminyl synthase (glutamine-hydrolysing)
MTGVANEAANGAVNGKRRTGPLRVVVVFPDLLGTYGDGGNGVVLAQRARWRGIDAELLQASSDAPVPEGDVYCLGGGEDGPQAQAADALRRDGTFLGAVERGAVVLAVCAGFQIVGRSFPDAQGHQLPGLGLLDVETRRGTGPRMVGEVVAEPLAGPEGPAGSAGPNGPGALPPLTGFENHASATHMGPGARPLASVTVGSGNGSGDGIEGAWSGRVLGTYLHGPVLARNPALADLLLGWALDDVSLAPIDDAEELSLRAERLAAATAAHPTSGPRGWMERCRRLLDGG